MISLYHEGHGGSQQSNVPLYNTLNMAQVACRGKGRSSPSDPLATVEVGTRWCLSLRRQRILDSCQNRLNDLGWQGCTISVMVLFIFPLVHLKASTKSSACGVRGSLSRYLNLALMSRKMGKEIDLKELFTFWIFGV